MKISYLRKIGYVVYVPLSPLQHTLKGSTQEIGGQYEILISVDCSIFRFLREDIFTTRMQVLVQMSFSKHYGRLVVPYIMPGKHLNAESISNSGSRTKLTEL